MLGAKSGMGGPHEDFPIDVHGENFLLAVRGKTIRLVKDGRYLDGKYEDHIPAKPLPGWIWIFFILHIALFFAIVGGAVGGAIAGGGITLCYSVARKNPSHGKGILYCSLVTLGSYVLGIIIVTVLTMTVL